MFLKVGLIFIILGCIKPSQEKYCFVPKEAVAGFHFTMEKEITVEVGSNVTFPCGVYNFKNYEDEISWSTPRHRIKVKDRRELTRELKFIVSWADCHWFLLNVLNVTVEDGGVYSCEILTVPLPPQETRLKVVLPGTKHLFSATFSDELTPEDSESEEDCSESGGCSPESSPSPRGDFVSSGGGYHRRLLVAFISIFVPFI